MNTPVYQIPINTQPFELSDLLPLCTSGSFHVLLDSTLVNKDTGRYSIFGAFPFITLRGFAGFSQVLHYDENQNILKEETIPGNPLEIFQKLFVQYNCIDFPRLPLAGGAMGYFSYELLHLMDDYNDIGECKKEGIDIPLLTFGFYDTLILDDKIAGEKKFIFCRPLQVSEKKMENIRRVKINRYLKMIENHKPFTADNKNLKEKVIHCPLPETDQIEKEAYLRAVETIIDKIGRGEIFQACYTYQKKTAFEGEPLALYRLLRSINAAPYSAYMDCGDFRIVSASPERFFSVDADNRIEARPIKGTRPRGKNEEEDRKNYRELETSVKDRAENVMITDLLRNDIGKNAELGSVQVKQLFKIETYATVFQLVSIVEGRGKIKGPDNLFRYLLGLFPGGSMTGAPKKRALEIINSLEVEKRGVYSGALGYLGFNGKADLNIVIRTAVIKDHTAYIGTGGGIVYDSTPGGEYAESNDKVEIILKAITYLNRINSRN